MTIAFEVLPREPLYFGPPASLPAGDTHHGRSLFPPPVSAWQGLVRTRLLEAAGLDLQDRSRQGREARAALVGGPDELPPRWRLEGPVPFVPGADGRAEGWFPTPLWVHQAKDDVDPDAPPRPLVAEPLRVPEVNAMQSDLSWQLVPVGAPKAGRTSPLGGWLGAGDLLRVLGGGLPAQLSREAWADRRTHWDLPPFVHWETRPGLALEGNTGTAREGMLYFVRTLRFSPGSGLAGWIHGLLPEGIPADALHEGTVSAGRKARPVMFAPLDLRSRAWDEVRAGAYLPPKVPRESCDFWLYLASAGRIEVPVRPTIPSPEPDVVLEVRAALLHKPVWQGGFSIETGRARPNSPFVPAGSAWLVRMSGGTPEQRARVLAELHGTSPLVAPSRAAFGEGRMFVGLISTQ